jgi:hypothetical protein
LDGRWAVLQLETTQIERIAGWQASAGRLLLTERSESSVNLNGQTIDLRLQEFEYPNPELTVEVWLPGTDFLLWLRNPPGKAKKENHK